MWHGVARIQEQRTTAFTISKSQEDEFQVVRGKSFKMNKPQKGRPKLFKYTFAKSLADTWNALEETERIQRSQVSSRRLKE